MKPSSPEMRALLATRQFFAADLWTFTLAGANAGEALRYCAGDADITANGLLYSAGGLVGPYFDRQDNKAKVHWKVGTATDQLVVDVLPGAAQVFGDPILDAIRSGIFDGAQCLLERAYMPAWGDTRVGVIRVFPGTVAEIDAGASLATLTINTPLELLNLQLPRNVAQIKCMNNLGDSTCLATVPSTTGVVGAAGDKSNFSCSISGSFADGTFDEGKVVFTSGVLDGFTATIKTCTFGGTDGISLVGFLPALPAPGDTFNIFYGCNKSLTDTNGCPKFSNTEHFRGFPFVPQPSVAI